MHRKNQIEDRNLQIVVHCWALKVKSVRLYFSAMLVSFTRYTITELDSVEHISQPSSPYEVSTVLATILETLY